MNPRNHKVKETQAATNAAFESKSPSDLSVYLE